MMEYRCNDPGQWTLHAASSLRPSGERHAARSGIVAAGPTVIRPQFLRAGVTVGTTLEAAREARLAVNYSLNGEVIDRAVPMVDARDPDARLTAPVAAVRAAKAPAATKSAPAPVARPAIRVAVVDLAHAFPDLEETLVRLTGAQGRFVFSAVDLVTPLGTWYVHQAPGEEPPVSYLYADRFAKRLSRKPKELGVDFLVCITSWPMVGEDDAELLFTVYGWWDETRKLPIISLSTAGLPLAPRGAETHRALADLLVTTLAGVFGQMDSHDRGPDDCPLFPNPQRDIAHIRGHQRFDSECLKRLGKSAPDELPALKARLDVLHEIAG